MQTKYLSAELFRDMGVYKISLLVSAQWITNFLSCFQPKLRTLTSKTAHKESALELYFDLNAKAKKGK